MIRLPRWFRFERYGLARGPGARRWGRAARALRWACRLYLVFALTLWLLLYAVGERWWALAPVVYGPRWLSLAPLLVLGPAAAFRPRLLLHLGAALAVLAGPVSGLCLPWRVWLEPAPEGPTIRVLSCNVDGEHLDEARLEGYLARALPDVVALQEWPPGKKGTMFERRGWHVRSSDEGLCVASRFPIFKTKALHAESLGANGGLLRCDLDTPDGVLHVIDLHLPTPRDGLEAMLGRDREAPRKLEDRLALLRRASAVASRWVDQVPAPVVLAGDFNMPDDSACYRAFWPGRANAFATAGLGWGGTKFTRRFSVRIDHVLAGPEFSFRSCEVGPDVGSDHRPVLAEACWSGATESEGGRP